ncbi:Cyclic AMP-dependent protein kinase-like protein regulatory subunit [Phytophthora palmivora]|uniref:Cyclic AMP-dependent protein kinase-like protein regulatory subunit n=1 Tax=Phytophthora palmivora TaxID=4796 RepID=A0A2P4YT44_9STRA|nr:Cyclic AMP-dependent protein kinase-like protein regulatory subunit [Phytophthora palmivora]
MTRYAVAVSVKQHTVESVTAILVKQSPNLRSCDGASALSGLAIETLVAWLQAERITPVPYRPRMIGLVERFHCAWKDMVSIYIHLDAQTSRDDWIDWAVYAYNCGWYSTVQLSPNELNMDRRLRAPNEQLRRTSFTEVPNLSAYHRQLLAEMKSSPECTE